MARTTWLPNEMDFIYRVVMVSQDTMGRKTVSILGPYASKSAAPLIAAKALEDAAEACQKGLQQWAEGFEAGKKSVHPKVTVATEKNGAVV